MIANYPYLNLKKINKIFLNLLITCKSLCFLSWLHYLLTLQFLIHLTNKIKKKENLTCFCFFGIILLWIFPFYICLIHNKIATNQLTARLILSVQTFGYSWPKIQLLLYHRSNLLLVWWHSFHYFRFTKWVL